MSPQLLRCKDLWRSLILKKCLWFLALLPLWAGTAPEEGLTDLAEQDAFDVFAWADLLYQDSDREGETSFFNLSQIYLSMTARFGERWSSELVLEYEREPSFLDEGEEELEVDRAFVEYRRSALARFRLGKLNTPAGILKPIHWTIAIDAISAPIMEDNDYIPTKTEGLSFLGTKVLPEGELNYHVIFGFVDEQIGNGESLDDARALGGDLHYIHKEQHRLGVSFYGYNDGAEDGNDVLGIVPYFELGFLQDQLIWRTEALWLDRAEGDVRSFYSKLKYRFTPRHYLNLRYEEGDDERRGGGGIRRATTVTLGWWPSRQWRVKAEWVGSRFAPEGIADFKQWAVWVGYIL